MNTKSKILVKTNGYDFIWGIGLAKDDENIDNPLKWRGDNLLGFILMNVRDVLS
ncbi:MAG: NADAR domain-containing protein [Clostridium sp.]|nr:NADAR domain-containing protein [Clostridium sp.]